MRAPRGVGLNAARNHRRSGFRADHQRDGRPGDLHAGPDRRPHTADVTVGLSSSDPTEGTPNESSVTFTTDNWQTPHDVVITGADDADPDGSQAYQILTAPAVSVDPAYDGVDPDDVDVTNTDDDIWKEWTLLFCMVADGQHEAGAINDINHTERAIDTTDINLVVQLDRASGDDIRNGDWTDTRRFFIEPDPSSDGVICSTEVAVLGEVNMGDPTSLADFISWGGQAYPAKRLAGPLPPLCHW